MLRPTLLALAGFACLHCAAAQSLDESYGKQIREFTTDPMFLTELVDHLPVSASVPTPQKALGYIAGAADHLTYAKDIHAYMRALERATARVKVVSIGKTEEGREMIVVLVSDEANLARLDHYKELTARLADPRKTSPAEAEKLLAEALPFYYTTGSIHSPETGAPEMLMELVYRLAVEESPFIQKIRKNVVVMVTPVVEVDGHERQVDLYRWRKANAGKVAPSLIYWGHYVQHDNNRDGIGLSLALSRNITKTFLDFHPQVLHDLHESVPYLYISTGMGPYNAWLDPIVLNEWQKLAWNEVEEMTRRGVPGVWTWGYYDGWGANYLMEAAHGHNAIGRFYETFGNGGADTKERTLPPAQTARAWYRQNPPLPKVKWSHRNNVNLQQSSLLLALNYTATNKETFLRNFYLKSQRAVAKPANEGPAAYVFDSAERPNEAASLVNLLKLQGVEVSRLTTETEVAGVKHPAGAYVVRMDQPYSRLADMLLDKQFYSPNDTPFDDTGWTLTALRNLRSTRVKEPAILKAPMVPVAGEAKAEGALKGSGTVYAINHNADRVLATLRFRLRDVKMQAAEAAFEAGGVKFNAGTFLIPAAGNAALEPKLRAAAEQLGVTVHALGEAPKVAAHALEAPRIALVHNWLNTQNEGWFRLALESTAIPYSYISDQKLREIADLRSRYDVIIYGPAQGNSQRLVNGLPMRGEPIPFEASELTPNFAGAPDTTSDMRGGMGLQGLQNVQKFVEQGGLFVTVGGNASIPIDFGLIDGVTISTARELKVQGSVLTSEFADAASPLAYGYQNGTPVYFGGAPLFTVSPTGVSGFGAREGATPPARPSGRGSADDADTPQGRPVAEAAPQPKPGEPTAEQLEQLRAYLPPPAERPRTILKFGEEKGLLISGLLGGGKELAGKPAIVDVPRGQGHWLLFAINPMWRQETQGSYMLLLNAAMNYRSLGVGRTDAKAQAAAPADDMDQ